MSSFFEQLMYKMYPGCWCHKRILTYQSYWLMLITWLETSNHNDLLLLYFKISFRDWLLAYQAATLPEVSGYLQEENDHQEPVSSSLSTGYRLDLFFDSFVVKLYWQKFLGDRNEWKRGRAWSFRTFFCLF